MTNNEAVGMTLICPFCGRGNHRIIPLCDPTGNKKTFGEVECMWCFRVARAIRLNRRSPTIILESNLRGNTDLVLRIEHSDAGTTLGISYKPIPGVVAQLEAREFSTFDSFDQLVGKTLRKLWTLLDSVMSKYEKMKNTLLPEEALNDPN